MKAKISVRIDTDELKKIQSVVEAHGESLSSFVRRSLRRELANLAALHEVNESSGEDRIEAY